MESLEDFLDSQQGEGRFESSGTFSIDFAKARDKIAQFSLPTPTDYLLKICQFANLLGASKLECRVGAAQVRLAFYGLREEAPSLREVASGLLAPVSGSHGQALRALLLGLNGALAAAPKSLLVSDRKGRSLILQAGGLELEEAQADGPDPETEDNAPSDGPAESPSPAFLIELIRKRNVSAAKLERAALTQRCCYGTTSLLLDGRPVLPQAPLYPQHEKPKHLPDAFILGERRLGADQGMVLPAWPDKPGNARDPKRKAFLRQLRGGQVSPLASHWILLRFGKAASRMHMVQSGVVVSTVERFTRMRGLDAVVDVSGLETDLTGLQLLQTPALEELKAFIHQQAYELSQDVLANLDRLYSVIPPDGKQGDTSGHNLAASAVGCPIGCMGAGLVAGMLPTSMADGRGSIVALCTFLTLAAVVIFFLRKTFLGSRFLSASFWEPLDSELRSDLRSRLHNMPKTFQL